MNQRNARIPLSANPNRNDTKRNKIYRNEMKYTETESKPTGDGGN